MALQRHRSIIPFLDEFRSFLSDRVPRFEIEHVNDRQWSDEKYHAQREAGAYSQSGVYFHFDNNEMLLYVGMATRGFDRFWDSRPDDARFTDVIAIPDEFRFLIPALEIFLIEKLDPPVNTQHRIPKSS